MNKNNIIYLAVLLVSLGICIAGLIAINVKPIAPLEKQNPCECVVECMRDFEEFGTFNYFTFVSHKSFSFESRACESVNTTIKATCCREIKEWY